MGITRPYRRTCRQFVDGRYMEGGRWQYMVHPKFAQSPEHYVRAFLIILKDLQELFDYVEPSDKNLSVTRTGYMPSCFARASRSREIARRSSRKTDLVAVAIGPWRTTRRSKRHISYPRMR